eukprot:10305935-Lingulodinium_polyedra.AAC.1
MAALDVQKDGCKHTGRWSKRVVSCHQPQLHSIGCLGHAHWKMEQSSILMPPAGAAQHCLPRTAKQLHAHWKMEQSSILMPPAGCESTRLPVKQLHAHWKMEHSNILKPSIAQHQVPKASKQLHAHRKMEQSRIRIPPASCASA